MALFYQHNINGGTKVGIWRIEEAETFFLEKVPLKADVSHPYKRLQHLAGRYLLPTLFEDFPLSEILIADTRKPFLEKEEYHFSISHSGNFAAALASQHERVGVDIELVTPRMYTIMHKFLHEDEQQFLKEWEHMHKLHLELTTILWSAKESIFKWYGKGQLSFRDNMRLCGPITFGPNEWVSLPFEFRKDSIIPLTVTARVFDPLVLAWVATEG
ncbi:MAG: 4'-phosphopantetheinyl transferase superfamily protein [Candidatus Pseudobacter hemicellulosilyticus]|uniref:4'-phosphopantetheinyl transferase superfamily protein n=1 Tax=Candidatus Pseudobacter hemicellulosilyticus TaxID=3121375 RepID=A0AAJ5WQE3_9BACT|nr:MAG: 4'-phosphopantetheinyl transferase superfamily protein [Pseudobacter sp.]